MPKTLANAVRFLSIDMVEKAKSGHPGMPMGMADVATILFKDFLKFNPKDPNWFNRDRFILSAGHGSALLYSLLYLTGYEDMTIDQLMNFRQIGSITPGHPEYGIATGIETTTGPLGQGISNAVGIALAERILNAKYGDGLVNHKTYVICSDGDLMEGISHEACSFAGHMKLNNLIVLYDSNKISIDGSTELSFSDNTAKRFEAYGWSVMQIDGHNESEIKSAIAGAQRSEKPVLIKCKTTIGFGSPGKEGSHEVHGSPLGADEVVETRRALEWQHKPFEVPDEILSKWRKFYERNLEEYKSHTKLFQNSVLKDELDKTAKADISKFIVKLKESAASSEASRVSSGKVLDEIVQHFPLMIGGSADLTPSNNTKTKHHKEISAYNYDGNYIHYGVREHAMAAIMNGLALHGLLPYGGSFLIFTDYARPAIRLSALMKLRVIYVMTHDSIGLGEDGPTHQPVEHLASLRAIPNMRVYRPSDAIETAECWELALANQSGPTILALSRQALKKQRHLGNEANLAARGAYILKEAKHDISVTIYATGSEVQIASETAELLEEKGHGVRVVSVPCLNTFFEQDMEYQMMFTCNKSLKVAIEAGSHFGWERVIGPHGLFVGVPTFGESAPYQKIYEHFGITPKEISLRIVGLLG